MTASIIRPLAIIGFLVMFLWPRYFFVTFAGKGISGFTFFTMLLLAATIVTLVMRPSASRTLIGSLRRAWPLLIAYVAFWSWRLLCDAFGLTPSASFALTGLDFLYFGSWTVIGAVMFTDTRVRQSLPYVIVISAVIATIFGLLERETGSPVSTMLGFYEFEAGDQLVVANFDGANLRGDVMRVKSLFSHPIVYGQILACFTPVALHLLLHGVKMWRRLLGIVVLVCVMISIPLANSRSAYFVLAAATMVYAALFYVDFKRGSRLFVALWLALIVMIVAPIATGSFLQMASGTTSEEASSSAARTMQMEKGTKALASRPLYGFGDGSAGPIAGILGRKNILTVDDFYLSTAVNFGYVGAAIFIVMIAAIALQGMILAYGETGSWQRSITAAYAGIVVSLGVGLSIVSINDTLSFIYLLAGYFIAMSGQRRVRRSTQADRGFIVPSAAPTPTPADNSPFAAIEQAREP